MRVGIYHTLGDGLHTKEDALAASVDILEGAAEGGAALLEIGLPFSDPLLDGPVIQASHGRALAQGAHSWKDLCKAISEIRKRCPETLLSVMTSAQLLYTPERRAALPKVDGLLVTDVEAQAECPFPLPSPRVWFLSQDVAQRETLAAPREDISMVYLTRLQGVTGEGQKAAPETQQAVNRIRTVLGPNIPIWLGFGISSRADVLEAQDFGVDGVVIGSAFVRALAAAAPARDALKAAAAAWVRGVMPVFLCALLGTHALESVASTSFPQAHTFALAQNEQPALAVSSSVDWIQQAALLSPREAQLNPNNVARVPRWTLLSQVRPDAKVEFGRMLFLVARPRVTFSASRVDAAKSPLPGAVRTTGTQSNVEKRWQEAFGTLTASDSLAVTYGIQNYQWGSAESYSPTNILYPEPQFDKGLYTEFAGQEMLRINLSAGQWGSLVLLGRPGKDETPAVTLAKAEVSFNSGSDSLGLVFAGGENRKPGFGETFSWNVTDALLVFGEAFHTKEPQGIETVTTDVASPVAGTPALRTRVVKPKSESDFLRTTAVGGFRVGFADGSECRLEGLYNEHGLKRREVERAYASTEGSNPVAGANTATLLRASGRLLATQAVFGSVRIIDLPPSKSIAFYARGTYFPQDVSYVALASVEFAWKDDTTFFGTFLHADHRKNTFAMNFAKKAGTAGVKMSW
ncbi:MAG: tryptophan synthase subunit alpha [Silvanigrellales bacterium]|nr:tryptophan synthase subunit alpha [Silvanigrellales bacterium]